MNILTIIPYKGYFGDFSSRLDICLNGTKNARKSTITTVMPPYYSCYSKTKKILDKKQIITVMLRNLFYFVYTFIFRLRDKYDTVVLASHIVAIPFLLFVKLLPFINIGRKFIVISFFLHGLGEKKCVKKLLRFLLNDKKIHIIVQSDYERKYYSQLMNKANVVHFPFCLHEVSFAEKCGKGQEYIFAGGYTNRDYTCLFEAARKTNCKFIVICSRLNQKEILDQKPANVKLLKDTTPAEFHGYMKNSKIVIIPLKEETGSSGQMVALAAMLFKKPVIYTNIDSISQYFEAGVSGVPYEINNAEDLAEKTHNLLSKPELCEQLETNAYKTYCDKYHISNYCKFLADLILRQ